MDHPYSLFKNYIVSGHTAWQPIAEALELSVKQGEMRDQALDRWYNEGVLANSQISFVRVMAILDTHPLLGVHAADSVSVPDVLEAPGVTVDVATAFMVEARGPCVDFKQQAKEALRRGCVGGYDVKVDIDWTAFEDKPWFEPLCKAIVAHKDHLTVGGVFKLHSDNTMNLTGRQKELDKAAAWLQQRSKQAESESKEAEEESTRSKNTMLLIHASSGCGKSRLAYEVARHLKTLYPGTYLTVSFNSGMDPEHGWAEDISYGIESRMLYTWLLGEDKVVSYTLFCSAFHDTRVAVPGIREVIGFMRSVAVSPIVFVFVDEPSKCTDGKIITRLSTLGKVMDRDPYFSAGFTCLGEDMRKSLKTASGRVLTPLTAGPLSISDSETLFEACVPAPYKTPKNRLLWKAAGGHGRCMETMYWIICKPENVTVPFKDILVAAAGANRTLINLPTCANMCRLIGMAVAGKKRNLTDVVGGTYTVDTAVQNGVVHAAIDELVEVPIRIPALVLVKMARYLGEMEAPLQHPKVAACIMEMVLCRGEVESMKGRAFEVFVAHYERLLNLLAAERDVPEGGFETLSNRYYGARLVKGIHYMGADADRVEVRKYKWSSSAGHGVVKMDHTLRNTRERVITGSQDGEENTVRITPSTVEVQGPVFLLADNNPGFDVFQVVESDVARVRHVVCIEARFSAAGSKRSKDIQVPNKMKSAKEVWSNSKNGVAAAVRRYCGNESKEDFFEGGTGTLIFMTIRKQKTPLRGTIVLGKDAQERLFGPLYYLVDMSH